MNATSVAQINGAIKLEGVQFLRAIAAALVLVEHLLGEAADRFKVDYDVVGFPWFIGVNIFFVISGFIMFYTSAGAFGQAGAPAKFLMRRVIRVVPLYFVFTTAMVLVLILAPGALGKSKFDLGHVIGSYLFWPMERYDGRVCPVLSLGWTLNYEMFFYVLFAGALFFRRRIAVPLMTVSMIGLVIIGNVFQLSYVPLRFWASERLIEFLAGAWIAIYVSKAETIKTNRAALASVTIASVGLAWIGKMNSGVVPEFFWMTLPSIAVVFGFTALLSASDGARLPRWAISLGDSSYSLYLSHRFPLRMMTLLWGGLIGYSPWAGVFYMFVAFVVCIGVGHAVHLWLERPLLTALKRLMNKKQARGAIISPAEQSVGI